MKQKIAQVKQCLKDLKIDGWLLYDFCGQNDLARIFLKIPSTSPIKRRFFYWIPKEGEPIKLVHAIEQHALEEWPGETRLFSSWQSLEKELCKLLGKSKRVAMEYSLAIPSVSKVDGGTIDLVRSCGVEVVSSADFLPQFTAVLDAEQAESHLRAGRALDRIARETWEWLKANISVTEYDVQQKILSLFEKENLVTDHAPIAAVNAHSANPHYAPPPTGSSLIQKGDFILIDLWAKEKGERAVFADITRVAVAADKPTLKQTQIFQIVRAAQKAAVHLVQERFQNKQKLEGWEVDEAARDVIRKAGYGDQFLHRTGHSIEVHLHGSGAHMDNLEMHDVRPILPGTCFSIEPGIYLAKEFGVRLEHDLYVDRSGKVHIVGGEQDEIVCLGLR